MRGLCGDFIEYRVSNSSVVMIFNYIQAEATNSRCAELIVVYCGGGGVVMERFIGAINRISGDYSTRQLNQCI